MRAAIIALAWSWLSIALLTLLAVAIGWYADHRSRTERASTVDRVEGYRRRLAWEETCAKAKRGRRAWDRQHKAKRRSGARLLQFRTKGGKPAA